MFHADTHVHSRFSRACSKDCDLPGLAWWALRKGITVVGTGDFTHPAWAEELAESLVPAEPGLLRLRPDLERLLRRNTPTSCDRPVRFMLSVEISTIYRRDDRTRKVHHLLYAPDFGTADRITTALSKIGNLGSDGRPILGLDSRDLLETTLAAGPGCYLVPAHVWTPWFAALGSKSGFDSVPDCYADLAEHIFAVETGLSSDPPMNWMCSALDSYRLVSNSDAHSPPMLGREATTFCTELNYFAMAEALRTGQGLAGTIEFYPEEGKYHLDGHRKCGVRLDPEQTRELGGICPRCGKPLTVGVLHRVADLADRPAGYRPPGAPASTNLIRLPEIMGELMLAGPRSKKVVAEVTRLVAALGPEIEILTCIPLEEITKAGGTLLGEAVARLRRGVVAREPGFDGEYGRIRLMRPEELRPAGALFDVPARAQRAQRAQRAPRAPQAAGPAPDAAPPWAAEGAPHAAAPQATGRAPHAAAPQATGGEPHAAAPAAGRARGATARAAAGPPADEPLPREAGPSAGSAALAGLDSQQRAAATTSGPVVIIAGPGTGKTRTLTSRIAYQVGCGRVRPEQCLALTFTRGAAAEMRQRLSGLIGPLAAQVTVTTFHGLGLRILREHHGKAGLSPEFTAADEAAAQSVAAEVAGSAAAGRRLVTRAATDPDARAALAAALSERDLVDFDGLVHLPLAMLRRDRSLGASLRERWPSISVDEYQDIDEAQYGLLREICSGPGLTVIGDPDQAIYGFRGCDVGLFLRVQADFPAASRVELNTCYRSPPGIIAAAQQVIRPSTLVPGRELRAATGCGGPQAAAGPDVTLWVAPDERAEAQWIAAEIDRLLGGASFHSLDTGRSDGHGHGGLALSDIAVLYRTDDQAAALVQALGRAGLPFQKRSHDRLSRRPAVRQILAQIAAVPGNPASTVAGRLRAAVRALARAADGPDGDDARTAGEVLRPLACRCGTDMQRFRTEVALGAEADSLDPRADAVTLLTLHAAKGLEFDVVFLAGCERGLLPLWLPGAERDEAEEARLLFVGMTRARVRLLVSCAAERTRYGATRPAGPSPFLAAVDPALLCRARPAAARARARQLRLL